MSFYERVCTIIALITSVCTYIIDIVFILSLQEQRLNSLPSFLTESNLVCKCCFLSLRIVNNKFAWNYFFQLKSVAYRTSSMIVCMVVVLNIISLVICKFQLKDLIFKNMFLVRQVQQLFPQLPLNVIIDDLHITRSVDLTIENVLDGLVQTPFQSAPPSPQPTPTTTSPPPITWQHTTTRSVSTVVVG